MRRILLTLTLCLLPAAAAGAETVTSTPSEDFLAGAWKLSLPGWERRGLTIRFGPQREHFCRFDGPTEQVRVRCLNIDGVGVVTRERNNFRIAWGGVLQQRTLDVMLETLHELRGSLKVRLLGVTWTSPARAVASRRPHRENVPDAGGKSLLLKTVLESRSHPSFVPKDAALQAPAELQALGPLLRVIHMGREDEAEIYAAEYEAGRRLCAIRQRGDGVLDQLRCV